MDYQIVLARYNEDITYLSIFKNIIIVYNKGLDNLPFCFNSIKIPNIGRESHTYLYHIIKNYDNLANKTLFIQGNIKDHRMLPLNEYFKNDNFTGFKTAVDINLIKNYISHSGKYLKDINNGKMIRSAYKPYDWIKLIGIDIGDTNNFEMVWGANFSVSKELIHKKPKIFYENLIKYVDYHYNPEEGHYFERAWYLIFNNSYFDNRKKILYYYNDIIDINIINKCNSILEKNNDIFEIHLWTKNISDTFFNNINNLNNLIGINKFNKNKNKNNKNNGTTLELKYTNTYNFVKIYPIIYDNTFDILFKTKSINFLDGKAIYLLFVFDNNVYYELEINQYNIILYDYLKEDFYNIHKNNYFLTGTTKEHMILNNLKYNKNIISKYTISNIENLSINNKDLLKIIEINITVKYINNEIKIYYNNINIINFQTNKIYSDIKVRSDSNNDLFLEYNNSVDYENAFSQINLLEGGAIKKKIISKISLMNSINNSIPNYFYKDNYENYYMQNLIDYYFDNLEETL
jgi:hypothetical protein